jgi:hypothetical protein
MERCTTFEACYSMRREAYLAELREVDRLRDEAARATDSATRHALLLRAEQRCSECGLYDFLLAIIPYVRGQGGAAESAPLDDAQVDDPQTQITSGFASVVGTAPHGRLFAEYMRRVEGDDSYEYVLHAQQRERPDFERCSQCGAAHAWHIFDAEASRSCAHCGVSETYQRDSTKRHTYRDEMEQSTTIVTFAYKRKNHFLDWLRGLEARNTLAVPRSVVDSVRYELRKMRVTEMDQITPDMVRQLLKKLRLNKHYDSINSICCELSGRPPVTLSPELKSRLCQMFSQIQKPFEACKPPDRKNFLSYSYVIYKFLELLNHEELLRYFPLLKSREKLHAQDRVWRAMCEMLRWEFVRSI